MLENFGFRVIDEQTYTVAPAGGEACYIHDMVLDSTTGAPSSSERAPLIEAGSSPYGRRPPRAMASIS